MKFEKMFKIEMNVTKDFEKRKVAEKFKSKTFVFFFFILNEIQHEFSHYAMQNIKI